MAAEVILAGISATFEAIQTWLTYKDARQASKALSKLGTSTPQIRIEAKTLNKLVPEEILKSIETRLSKCWTRYNDVLTGGSMPGEIDEATERVKKCICEELRRINALSGGIPEGIMLDYWVTYGCATNNLPSK